MLFIWISDFEQWHKFQILNMVQISDTVVTDLFSIVEFLEQVRAKCRSALSGSNVVVVNLS